MRRGAKIALLAGILCAALVVAGGLAFAALRPGNKQADQTQEQHKAILRTQLKHGVGEQVKLARRGDSAGEVRESVESVASFINRRSGLILSETVKERLASLELESLNHPGKRIGVEDLTGVITSTAAERLASLSDKEIARMAADMDTGFSGGNAVSLRGNGRGSMSLKEFANALKDARAASRNQDAGFQKSLGDAISGEVNSRAAELDENASSHFGGVRRHGLTPVQAMLLVYSVASDDPLAHSQETLEEQAQKAYSRIPGGFKNGRPLVRPYGPDGYRYATPLDIVLDEGTVGKLLDRMEEVAK
jgi:hypothetical protein